MQQMDVRAPKPHHNARDRGLRARPGALTRSLGLTVSAFALTLGLAAAPQSARAQQTVSSSEAVISFSIPGQDLNSALLAFASRAGVQLFYDVADVQGRRSQRVSGQMTAAQAIGQLLAGSGVGYRFTGPRSISLSLPVARSGAGADGAVQLDAVTLEAGVGGITEGTGSYTTGEARSATGLALSLRETPQSVTVVTSQRIEDQKLQSTREVLSYTTGISSYTSETDRDSTYARGYWVGNYVVDGVNLPTYEGWYSGASLHSTASIYDRVETLRGAAGLLTGTGEPGAAISMTRKRAISRETTGSVELRYGTWNRLGGTLDITTPLNTDGSIRGRFIADVASEESFIERYQVNKQTYYGTIEADLDTGTRLTFSVEHRNHDPRGSKWGDLPAIFADGTPTDFDRSFSNAPAWAHWSSKQTSVVARADHEFDNGWKANAVLGWTKRSYDAELLYMWGDLDRATGTGLNASIWKGEQFGRLLSMDATLSGPVELFGRTHQLNFGVHQDRDWKRYPSYRRTSELVPVGNIDEWDGSYPLPTWEQTSADTWKVNKSKFSAYASGQFTLSDPLKVVAGARYTDWRGTPDWANGERHFTTLIPFAGVVYDVTDNISLYASYTEVFDPQDYRDRTGKFLDPVEGKSEEIGAKGEFFDGRMNATLALFRSYKDNVATRDGDVLVPGTGDFAYYGAKGVESKGVELEVSGEIAPGWNLFAGASTLKMTDAAGATINRWTPTRTFKLFTSYDLPGQLDAWTVGGGLRWQNSTWDNISTATGTHRFTQPGYTVVDLMARYEFSEQWSAQLNVNNIFDKAYFGNAGSQPSWGEPRNAMLTLVSKF